MYIRFRLYIVNNKAVIRDGYDSSMLVAAGNQKFARGSAAEKAKSSGMSQETWLNKKYTSCRHVGWAKRDASSGVIETFKS